MPALIQAAMKQFKYNICTCRATYKEDGIASTKLFKYNICTCRAVFASSKIFLTSSFKYNICTCRAKFASDFPHITIDLNTTFVHVEPAIELNKL